MWGGGMDHMRTGFTPWGLLFQGSCSLFHGHHRVTFSAGSDLYFYLPSVVNELCALGQVTNLSSHSSHIYIIRRIMKTYTVVLEIVVV